MSALTLRGVAFQPLDTELFDKRPHISDSFKWLSDVIGSQVKDIIAPLSVDEQAQINRHFLCSTMIELPFTTGDISWSAVAEMLAEHGEFQPDTFINAYECASWGYSLRHYLQHNKDAKFLLVSIVDANLYDLEFWRYNEHWHDSGFGVTTVLLEVTGTISNELNIGCAVTHNAMAEFATVVRRDVVTRENCVLAMPFFPENIQQMFDKLLAKQSRLPDRHADWGHCFGADPWLNILCHCLDNEVTEDQQYLACSLALNGYYALAEVTVTPSTQFILSGRKGYE
jgi:hypothetical protein